MTNLSRSIRSLVMLALLAPMSALAQPCSNYTFVPTTPTGITPGTTLISEACDDCDWLVSFPFPVNFYGTMYTQAWISSNGVIAFGGSNHSYGNECLPTGHVPGPALFAMWDDLSTLDGGTGVYTSVLGSAPNRIFEVEWNVRYLYSTNPAHFVVRMYEGQTRMVVEYAQVTTTALATIGIQGSSTGPATMLTCDSPIPITNTAYVVDCAAPRITYQGKLTLGGYVVNGAYDMRFTMFHERTDGTPVSVKYLPDVQVEKGLFTVALDMPNMTYNANPLYLEIEVNGVTLVGRQELTYAPKSAYAIDAAKALEAEHAAAATRADGLKAPDGDPYSAVYTTNDGSVYIPGTLYVGAIVPAPYPQWLVIPPSGLDPISEAIGHIHTSAGELVGTIGNQDVIFQSWLHLPQNATITRIEFFCYDNVGGGDIALTLERVRFDSPTSQTMASVQTDGAFAGYRQFSTGSIYVPFDVQNEAMVLRVRWITPPGSFNLIRMSNIRVYYTVGHVSE